MRLARPDLRRFAPWLLVAAGGLALLPGSAGLPLVDRDEPRFAEATRQMVATGEWVVPQFNGAPRYDKPPLTYWLMALGYDVAGIDELGARLHSVVTAILVALVLWWAGTRWFGPGPGIAAGLFWLLSLQVLIHGRAARAFRAVGLGLGGGGALVLLGAAARVPVPGLPTALGGAALVVVGLLAAAPLYRRLRPAPLAAALVAIAAGFVLIAGGLRRVTPAIELERGFFSAIPPGAPCAWQGFEEPSLVFYGRREWRPLDAWQPDRTPECAVVEERSVGLGALLAGTTEPATESPAVRRTERWLVSRGLRSRHVAGFDVARASWVELSAWTRAAHGGGDGGVSSRRGETSGAGAGTAITDTPER